MRVIPDTTSAIKLGHCKVGDCITPLNLHAEDGPFIITQGLTKNPEWSRGNVGLWGEETATMLVALSSGKMVTPRSLSELVQRHDRAAVIFMEGVYA